MADTSLYDQAMEKVLTRFRKPVEVDEFAMREAMRRGTASKHLQENKDLVQMLEAVEGVYMNAWRGSEAHDTQIRERCHIAVSVINDFRNYLRAAVENGEAAARELEKARR